MGDVCQGCKTDSPGPRFEVWVGAMFERQKTGWHHDSCHGSNRAEIKRLKDRLKANESAMRVPQICTWVYISDFSKWDTDCGEAFQLSNDATLCDNKFEFCPFCGKKINEV